MRTDWNEDFIKGLKFIRRFAERYQVIGPITLRLTFANRHDSEHFKAGLKMDCKELFYDLQLHSFGNLDKLEMCGMKIEIEHFKQSMPTKSKGVYKRNKELVELMKIDRYNGIGYGTIGKKYNKPRHSVRRWLKWNGKNNAPLAELVDINER